jgi:hypothetical protein
MLIYINILGFVKSYFHPIYHIYKFKIYDSPNWLKRDYENVINKESKSYENTIPLFDVVNYSDTSKSHSLGALSLKEISESYFLSLSFLGDFCVQMGCPTPININSPTCEYLTGDQLFNIIQAVTSLDPLDSNIDYDSIDLEQITEEFGITIEKCLQICQKEKFNLPFGKDSTLHILEADRLRNLLESMTSESDDRLTRPPIDSTFG